jgi:hypothetical protein
VIVNELTCRWLWWLVCHILMSRTIGKMLNIVRESYVLGFVMVIY